MRHLHAAFILTLLGLALAVLIAPAAAHSPTDLTLSYDPGTGELQATFTHRVEDPATHYVKTVRIEEEGGPVLLEQEYTSQPTFDTFTYTYPIQVPPGATLQVQGECSIGGEITRSLVIPAGETTAAPTATPTVSGTAPPSPTPETTPPPTTATPQTPGFTVLIALLALAVVGGALLGRR